LIMLSGAATPVSVVNLSMRYSLPGEVNSAPPQSDCRAFNADGGADVKRHAYKPR
jgi:hypothetical protein